MCVQVLEKSIGLSHPVSALAMLDHAAVLLERARFTEAEEACRCGGGMWAMWGRQEVACRWGGGMGAMWGRQEEACR